MLSVFCADGCHAEVAELYHRVPWAGDQTSALEADRRSAGGGVWGRPALDLGQSHVHQCSGKTESAACDFKQGQS